MMNKTAQTDHYRLFLTEGLPEPLTPASSHIQIFDDHLNGTRLRVRSIRDPYTKAWTYLLQQQYILNEADAKTVKFAEIHLNEAEHDAFDRFEEHEIRKNRYFHEFDGREVKFDVFLGDLWGLNTARVDFASHEEMAAYVPPPFAAIEVSGNEFFLGSNLVSVKFADVQDEVARIMQS